MVADYQGGGHQGGVSQRLLVLAQLSTAKSSSGVKSLIFFSNRVGLICVSALFAAFTGEAKLVDQSVEVRSRAAGRDRIIRRLGMPIPPMPAESNIDVRALGDCYFTKTVARSGTWKNNHRDSSFNDGVQKTLRTLPW